MKRYLWGTLMALFIAAACEGTALGAETVIKQVTVEVEASIEADTSQGTVSVSGSTSGYRVVSAEFINDDGSWNVGEVPKANIILEAEEGYCFAKLTSSRVTIHGAKYVGSENEDDNHTAVITVKLDPVKGTLGEVEDAYWEENSLGKAKWSRVDGAPAYEVKLYHGDSLVYHVKKTTVAYYDFYGYMTSKGDYYFKVRTIPKTESQEDYLLEGQWTESGIQELTLRDAAAAGEKGTTGNGSLGSDKTPQSDTAGWAQDGNGWWYREEDGSYPINCWKQIAGKWYLFGMDGYMLTGWRKWNGKDFYLTSNGDMVAGWFQDNRQWYYLDTDKGMLNSGWMALGDQWYYMKSDGTMATGWISLKDRWYYLDPEGGQMVKNCMVGQYYINPDGIYVP